ncbi:MAG: hypothetical protein SWH61_05210 [Thermodesulfobacteriota bacterium]|nr:hypothetical protein [Thermodesulfobacteriota bacterium]
MKPFRQGDLDGLCGIYSVVNAVRYIKKLSSEQSEDLFYQCLSAIEKENRLSDIVAKGINLTILTTLFKEIIDPNFGIKRTRPFHKRKDVSLDCYWNHIATFLKTPERVVLASIDCSDCIGHWSIIIKASHKVFHMYDSYEDKRWYRRLLSTQRTTKSRPYIVSPPHTFFLG